MTPQEQEIYNLGLHTLYNSKIYELKDDIRLLLSRYERLKIDMFNMLEGKNLQKAPQTLAELNKILESIKTDEKAIKELKEKWSL